MALQRIWIASPNYSSRGGAGVRLIVLHTAEGSKTFQSLGSYFSNPASQVSSHVGIDDTPNVVGEYVKRGNKAWTQGNANPVAVAAELCAFASWSTADWHSHQHMLNNAAAWVAEEAAAYGIPIVALSASQAQGGGTGVCQHRDLGSWGGNHSDCGNGFPLSEVISIASGGASGGAPTPPLPPPPPSGGVPAFPYPSDDYLGTPRSDPKCHSGHYGPPDSGHVSVWQSQMAARGWGIGVDGDYGSQSESVCKKFQAEKGLGVDGLVGPQTWGAAWTAPVS